MTKEEFSKLTNLEQRVAVAKDVLAKLDANKYRAKTNSYVKLGIAYRAMEELETVSEAIESANVCEVCAVGAAFCSLLSLSQEVLPLDMNAWGTESTGKMEIMVRGTTGGAMAARLADMFGPELDLIEAAFEQSSTAGLRIYKDHVPECDLDDAVEFSESGTTSYQRLRAIMLNIVHNGGRFIP